MNVWIENPFDNLPLEGYRPQRYWLMAEAFAAAGHAVTLWTSDFSHAHKRPRVLTGDIAALPFRLIALPTRPYARNVSLARLRSHRAYARTFRAHAAAEIARGNTPDVLIVSMPPLSTCAVALALKRQTGCRLVFDVQDAWPETFIRLFPRGFKWMGGLLLWPLARMARAAYRGADRLTGAAERYANVVASYGGRPFRAFPHGILMPERVSTARGTRPQALVYIGSLGQGYDLGTVIRGLAELPEATLDIAGAGEREAEWKALAAGNPRVRFHGYLDQKGLSDLLCSCTVGVIPMREDSFVGIPYKLADYAAHGLLTVTSLRGNCAALLERDGLGIGYAWGDPASFAAAVRRAAALQPNFEPIREQIDARRIYPAYVKWVEQLKKGDRPPQA